MLGCSRSGAPWVCRPDRGGRASLRCLAIRGCAGRAPARLSRPRVSCARSVWTSPAGRAELLFAPLANRGKSVRTWRSIRRGSLLKGLCQLRSFRVEKSALWSLSPVAERSRFFVSVTRFHHAEKKSWQDGFGSLTFTHY
eukprot:1285112-Prymnesium_polylepis.1